MNPLDPNLLSLISLASGHPGAMIALRELRDRERRCQIYQAHMSEGQLHDAHLEIDRSEKAG